MAMVAYVKVFSSPRNMLTVCSMVGGLIAEFTVKRLFDSGYGIIYGTSSHQEL